MSPWIQEFQAPAIDVYSKSSCKGYVPVFSTVTSYFVLALQSKRIRALYGDVGAE
jgi:hypothetical protein